jgi:hypothetical protein
MLMLALIFCLTDGSKCLEHQIVLPESANPIECLMNAQAFAAQDDWALAHPNYNLSSWRCFYMKPGREI